MPMPPDASRERALTTMLVELFDPGEILRIARELDGGLFNELFGRNLGLSDLADEFVRKSVQRGIVGNVLFTVVYRERSHLGQRIAEVARRWDVELETQPLPLSIVPSEANAALASPSQRAPADIFISYSRKDEAWKDRVVGQLQVLAHEDSVTVWDDTRIAAGDAWKPAIGQAMTEARAAILLVSADFLTSEFVRNTEVPKLLERRRAEGVHIFPVIIRSCAWKAVDWLSALQCRPKDGKALSLFSEGEIEQHLSELVMEIHQLLAASTMPLPSEQPPHDVDTKEEQDEDQPVPPSLRVTPALPVHAKSLVPRTAPMTPHQPAAPVQAPKRPTKPYASVDSAPIVETSPRRRGLVPAAIGGVGVIVGVLLLVVPDNDEPDPPPPTTGSQRKPHRALGVVHTALADAAPMRFVGLSGGTFTMGSPASETGREDDESPHIVTVSPFEISESEVTQQQWQLVMGPEQESQPNRCSKSGCADDLPVQQVSWFDAIEFVNALSEREGKSACYRRKGDNVTWKKACDGYRLPTEAEWEYACRAGRQTAYSFANDPADLDKHAWFGDNSEDNVHPVRQLRTSGWGIYDMHGNLWEWVWDWYGPYPEGAQLDPRGPANANASIMDDIHTRARLLRGGSYRSKGEQLRCAHRGWFRPSYQGSNYGLRVVRSSGQ